MKISQLQPGHKIQEHNDSGEVIHYEVVSVNPVGKMIEVTFRTVAGLTSALYPANAFIPVAA